MRIFEDRLAAGKGVAMMKNPFLRKSKRRPEMGDWQYIDLLFQSLLGRNAQPEEALRYIEVLRDEPDLRLIADRIMRSDEYRLHTSEGKGGRLPLLNRRWESNSQLPIRRILVVKGDHLGDLIMTLPAVSMLKRAFPGAQLTLLCSPWNKDIAAATGMFDEIVCAPLDVTGSRDENLDEESVSRCIQIVKSLPQSDVAVILKPEDNSNFLVEHIRSRIISGFGLDKYKREEGVTLLSLPTREETERIEGSYLHTSELLCLLVGRLTAKLFSDGSVDIWDPVRAIPKQHPGHGLRWPQIGLNTGAGAETRRWPAARFAELCLKASAKFPDASFVLFGTKDELPEANRVLEACDGKVNIISVVGQTSITEFVSHVSCLHAYIGNDTGTTHVASILCPTICLSSGVTFVERFGPLGPLATTIRADVACYGCAINSLKMCPNLHLCMHEISTDQVMCELDQLIDRFSAPAALHKRENEK